MHRSHCLMAGRTNEKTLSIHVTIDKQLQYRTEVTCYWNVTGTQIERKIERCGNAKIS